MVQFNVISKCCCKPIVKCDLLYEGDFEWKLLFSIFIRNLQAQVLKLFSIVTFLLILDISILDQKIIRPK